MNKSFLSLGAFFGALAVAMGAFGAHGLKKVAPDDVVEIFKTGVQYQMYHALALLLVAMVYDRIQNHFIKWSGYLFVIGILFFSGSLYLITALKASDNAVSTFVGVLTPLGGFFFILGWLSLLVGSFNTRSGQRKL